MLTILFWCFILTLDYGVLQGSILGPTTLFYLLVNDIYNIVRKYTVIQYADDSLLILVHKNLDKT
ncbi:hypothetical protein J437_LFUL018562, partial [Ladona fulva]